MVERWYIEKKHEHFYKEAKKKGYRARSAFKLKQIQKKFNIIKTGDFVLDLGAAPGGWSQVASELVGVKGKVLGVDLLDIAPLDGVTFFQGDMTRDETVEWIIDHMGDRKVDVVLSDMSPNISGNYSMDQAQSVFLCMQCLKVCGLFLKNRGNLVCKVFEGEDINDLIVEMQDLFGNVKRFSPNASRKSSSELYIICKNYKK